MTLAGREVGGVVGSMAAEASSWVEVAAVSFVGRAWECGGREKVLVYIQKYTHAPTHLKRYTHHPHPIPSMHPNL
jgi:hypothetical protein